MCFLKTLSVPLTSFDFCDVFLMNSDFNKKYYLTEQALEKIEATDLLIYKDRAYLYFFGNLDVILNIFKQSSFDFCQTFKYL